MTELHDMSKLNNIQLTKFVYKLNIANTNEFAVSINPKTLSFFTDGSCSGNGKKTSVGAFSAICVSGYKKNTLVYAKVNDLKIKATNIRAEGSAIITVLKILLRDIECDKWNHCIIYSDSEFWIKMIYNYMPKWSTFNFAVKANPDMTTTVWNLWTKLQMYDKKIEMVHVYAHNKDNSATSPDPFKRFCHDNNYIADELASIAREMPDYEIIEEKI
jgi:ribonuclease HI